MQALPDSVYAKVFKDMAKLSDKAFFIYGLVDHKLYELSPAFENIWEILPPLVYDDPQALLQRIYEEDRREVESSLKKIIDERLEKLVIQYRIYGKRGQIKYISTSLYFLIYEEVKLLCGSFEDISAAQQERVQREKLLKTKDFMLDVMTHNLAGPLQRSNMLLSFLEQYLPEEKDHEAYKIFHMLLKCNGTASEIINSFIKQELLETGQVEVKKQRVNLTEKIRELFATYRQYDKASQKKLVLEVPNNGDFFVEIDEIKFMEAIKNLFSNALKFTEDKGKVTISLEHADDYDLIKVADNGIGIPKELQTHLFNRFTKARRTGLKGEEPVGLGMGIVKTIVELHQGEIWLQSVEEKGTTFFIKLPH